MSNEIKYFKIYGQMRTGTNYISSILVNNFINTTVFMNVGGWKHGKLIEFPTDIELVNMVDVNTVKNIEIDKKIDIFAKNKVNFLVIIKNPYMWIHSVLTYKKKEITPSNVIKYIKNWNDIYSNYKDYIECGKAYLVKYETLLQHPDQTLDKIKKKFNLIKKKSKYIFENNILSANNDYTIGKTINEIFDKNKYISPIISKYLSNDIITIINENIDKTLMKFYKYNLEKV
jgi:hypothetical protein